MTWKKGTMASVKVSRDTHERLQDYKERTGVSITFVMEKAVAEYLDRMEKKDG